MVRELLIQNSDREMYSSNKKVKREEGELKKGSHGVPWPKKRRRETCRGRSSDSVYEGEALYNNISGKSRQYSYSTYHTAGWASGEMTERNNDSGLLHRDVGC